MRFALTNLLPRLFDAIGPRGLLLVPLSRSCSVVGRRLSYARGMRSLTVFAFVALLSACAPYEGTSLVNNSVSGEEPLDIPVDDPVVDPGEPQPPEDPEPPFVPQTIFSIQSKLINLAHGKGQRWDGCDKDSFAQGGYLSNTKCGAGTFLPAYAKHLNEDFYQCIIDAAEAAGLNKPKYIFINHVGTYNNRTVAGSGTLSFHAYARAMDISSFNLIDDEGKRVNISTHINKFKGATIPFYNEFRQCWKESLASKGCKPGDREYKGSIGHTKSAMGGNSSHADHIHMSFPFCAG